MLRHLITRRHRQRHSIAGAAGRRRTGESYLCRRRPKERAEHGRDEPVFCGADRVPDVVDRPAGLPNRSGSHHVLHGRRRVNGPAYRPRRRSADGLADYPAAEAHQRSCPGLEWHPANCSRLAGDWQAPCRGQLPAPNPAAPGKGHIGKPRQSATYMTFAGCARFTRCRARPSPRSRNSLLNGAIERASSVPLKCSQSDYCGVRPRHETCGS